MRNWKYEPFTGSLLEIIESCAAWLPAPEDLVAAQEWLIDQLEVAEGNPTILLPLRRFKDRPNRGEVFITEDFTFVPVDNEPAAALYEHLREYGAHELPGWTLRQLFNDRKLPASWSCDQADQFNQGWLFQPAACAFRNHSIQLAHIFDAGQKSLGTTVEDMFIRYFRTMNPINLFPMPAVRGMHFIGDLEGDIAENGAVQDILRGAMMEYIDDQPATEAWHQYSGIEKVDQGLRSTWKSKAAKIHLKLVPKPAQRVSKPLSAGSTTSLLTDCAVGDLAAPKTVGARNALSLNQLADVLSKWVLKNAGGAIRLDGKPYISEGNRTAWLLFRVDHFTGENSEWNGIYRFHGDTTIDSIRELMKADTWEPNTPPPMDQLIATIKENLQPAWTRSKKRSLVVKGNSKPNGFYCFQHAT